MTRFFDELEDRLRASAAEVHGASGADAAPERDAGAARSRRRLRPPRRLLAVAIVVGIAGAAVPAISAVTDIWRPEVEGRSRPMPAATAPASGGISCGGMRSRPLDAGPPVGEAFTSVLGVLGRPRKVADRIDRKYLRWPGVIGVDVAGIRRAGVTAGGRPYYVIPARGMGPTPWPRRCLRGLTEQQRRMVMGPPRRLEPTICTMSGGGGCGPLSDIARHGTYGASGTVRGRATVSGLAPNGVRAVRVTYGRSTRTFPVRDNFFTFRLDGIDVERALPPDRLEWLMDDGSVRDVTR